MTDYDRIALDWDRITHDCAEFARELHDQQVITPDTKGLIALARGGLGVAHLLANYLDIRRVEAITIKSYDGMTRLAAPTLLGTPSPDLGDGTGWVVVDDLVDTGGSFRFVKQLLPNARYVALYAKPEGLADADVTLATFAQDTWLDFPWEVQKIN